MGTDGSRRANRAIVAAAQLAQVTGAELCIHTVGGNLSGQEAEKRAMQAGAGRSNYVQARASPPK